MKKYILIAVTLLMGIGVFYYIIGTAADNNFAVNNTDDITRIELENNSEQVILTKTENGKWLVSAFNANMSNIANLKTILSDIEVEYPLPKIYEPVYTSEKITGEGISLKIYKDKNIIKSYSLLFDSIGTIGVMGNKGKPYVVDLPGRDIDLEDYIVIDPVFWENNVVFSFLPEQIKHIKLDDKETPENSYVIEWGESPALYSTDNNRLPSDSLKIKQYISYFNNVSFYNNLSITDNDKQTLLSAEPLYVLTIGTEKENLTCRIVPIPDNGADDYNNPLVYNRDFFNLIIPERGLFAKAQWLAFDILIEEISYFKL